MTELPKILAVDDNRHNLIALRRLLEKDSCELFEALDGNTALSLCLEHQFALILLDVDMPIMDGYEVAQLLKDEPLTRDIPIIFVTAAFEDIEHRIRGYQAGAVDYIQKPIDDFIFQSKVRIFLDLYTSREALSAALEQSEAMRVAVSASEERFRRALQEAPIPVMLCADDGEVLMLSRVWTELSGFAIDEIKTITNWIEAATAESAAESLRDHLQTAWHGDRVSVVREHRLLTRNGTERIWELHCAPLPSQADGRRLMITAATDITERREREEAQRLALTVFNTVGDGVLVSDAENCILSVNPAFTQITGYSPEEVIGQNPRLLNSGKHPAAFFQTLWQTLQQEGCWQGEIWNRRKNGEIYTEWLSIHVIKTPQGEVQQYVAVFSDITSRKKSEEIIWRQANFDVLTNLPNRRMFQDRLRQEIKKAHRHICQMAVLFIDLDLFKEVNDTLGHEKGDELLIEAAQRIGSTRPRSTNCATGASSTGSLPSASTSRRSSSSATSGCRGSGWSGLSSSDCPAAASMRKLPKGCCSTPARTSSSGYWRFVMPASTSHWMILAPATRHWLT